MDERLIALYHQHVAAAYDQQMRLSDFLDRKAPGANWHYQVSAATLSFGESVQFQAHDLGSHAEPDNSWMWVWCNPHMKLTPANEALGAAVRGMGERLGIHSFSATSYFDVGPVLGDELGPVAAHVFGIVVGGELGYNAYYTMPFDNGRFTALLRDDRLRCEEPYPLLRVATYFSQLLSGYPVLNHRSALIGYLEWYGFTPEVEGQVIRVVENGTELMRAEFDELNRMTSVTGRFQGSSESPDTR